MRPELNEGRNEIIIIGPLPEPKIGTWEPLLDTLVMVLPGLAFALFLIFAMTR